MNPLALTTPVLADAGGPALAGALFVVLGLLFLFAGLVVGTIVYLVARGRAKKRLQGAPAVPPTPPPY